MLPRALKPLFAAAVSQLLRPLVRQIISYGMSYPAFDRIVRQVFVEAAERDFALPGKRATDSRIALVTGINRKEVASLRQRVDTASAATEVEDNLVTHVIGRWMAGPPYATPDGLARRLPYESQEGRTASFAQLVRSVAGVDIPVRSVLDELLRIGVVQRREDGSLVLCREGNLPADDVETKLALLGSEPAELFRSIVHNIEQPAAAWLQRKIAYDNIGSDALPQLQQEIRRLGEEYLRRLNALLASYDRDRNAEAPGGARARVAVGIYYFEEEVRPEASSGKEPPTKPVRRRRSL
ncbi:MAG TPA: DUF6502 family protein [Terriglobales bacterium]|nr:DUF6502 family protein [Terriglobales bacterium]